MALVRYKNPTDYCFYKWISQYPNSKYWLERIKKHPELKLSPLLGVELYTFIKTARQNRATAWLKWERVERLILKVIPIFKKDDLDELKFIFNHLVKFCKAPALKQGFVIENIAGVKNGFYVERGIKRGKFYEKITPSKNQKGAIAIYDKKRKEYKILKTNPKL